MSLINPTGQFKDVLKASISDITAGFTLLIVSLLLFLEMSSVLRNPIFNGAMGILFLYLAFTNKHTREYYENRENPWNIDINSIIVGIFLMIVSLLGALGNFGLAQNFLFPLIPGILLIAVAILRFYIRAAKPDYIIHRTDPCGIVGGEVLIFYSILLYMDLTSLAWSPVFPLFASAAIYTVLFIDILPQIRSDQAGIHDAAIWLNEIEEKISSLKNEYESLRLAQDSPQISTSLERLNTILEKLIQLRQITAAQFSYEEKPAGPAFSQRIVKPVVPQKNTDTRDLQELVGPTSDEIFYENLQKEFDKAGLTDIIREAREIRNSIVSNRKKEE